MKVIPAVRWFLKPELIKELETEHQTFIDFVRYKILINLYEQIAELDPLINYLARLMFDHDGYCHGAEM